MHTTTTSEPVQPDFSGLWIPLITPFHGGTVDFPALEQLVKRLCTTGIAGFVACGSTGEAAALDEAEQLAVLEAVLAASGGVPVVMGLSGYHLPQTLAWVRQLCQRPIAGLLVPAPHYIRPSQAGLVQWFSTLADASSVPLIVYDIPYRTGATLALDTLRQLARHPRIRAIKDCGGDAAKTQALIAEGQLQVLAGEDAQIFTTVALGGAGAIAASAHVQTEAFVQLLASLAAGQLPKARQQWQPLLPLIQALFEEPNPGPVKALLARQGWLHNELRPPMTVASVALADRLLTLCKSR